MDERPPRRRSALAQLGVMVGDRTEQVDLPDVPAGRMRFFWALDGQFLLQRSDIPDAAFPDSLAIITVAEGDDAYTQHYLDSRGVTRTYAMTLDENTWVLLRDRPDVSPLDFAQRVTDTFAEDTGGHERTTTP